LKTLNEASKLTFIALPGNHLQFTEKDVETIFVPFLTNTTMIETEETFLE